MKGQDISERLLELGVQIVEIVRALPRTETGRHVARQLLRAGTSAGANYEEARSAESPADFVHKVGLAAKECREALYWVRLVARTGLATDADMRSVVREANELVAILTASARTARERGVERERAAGGERRTRTRKTNGNAELTGGTENRNRNVNAGPQ